MKNHNHIAVWAMIIVHQLLGYIWYSSFLFLNPWLAGQGKTMDQFNTNDPSPIIWSIITNILAAYTISWLVSKLNVNNFLAGAKLGLILFMGFSLLALASHYQFLGIADSVMFIDLGLLLIWTVLTAGVLAVWKRKV